MTNKDPLLDFRNFLFLVWHHLNLPDPTPVQYDIAHWLQHGPKALVIEAFRGVGKSWITSAFVIWSLYCNPQLKIMVVSASKQRADDFSTFTKRLIYEIPQLHHLIPREGQRQSNVGFDVGPARAAHAPSVKSVGITGQLTGSRADIIVADDVEVPNNSATETMREFIANAVTEFDDVVMPETGRIIYLGTPHTEQSLYNKLAKRGYTVRIWPVLYPDAKQIAKYGSKLAPTIINQLKDDPSLEGKATDPRRFNDEVIEEKRIKKGLLGFTLQYMLDTSLSDAERYPLKTSDLIVMSLNDRKGPTDVIWAADPANVIHELPNVGLTGDRFYAPMEIEKNYTDYTGAVMAIDPSGRGTDETAYCVLKMLHGRLYCTAAGGFRGGYSDETLEALVKIAEQQQVKQIIVEPNFGDGMFAQLLRAKAHATYNVSIEDAKWSRQQKERRIIDTLEPVLNQHRLIFDPEVVKSDYESVEGYDTENKNAYRLFYQMTHLTSDKGAIPKDDRLDALSMAVSYWLDYLSQDTGQAKQKHADKLLKEELKNWHKSVVMSTPGVGRRRGRPRRRGGFFGRNSGVKRRFGK